jgi:DNA-binding NtrC family response regulator
MAEPRVLVLDETNGQNVGNRIHAILERTNAYRVVLVSSTGHVRTDGAPDLGIVVLPCDADSAVRRLEEVRTAWRDVPLLPVLQPGQLVDELDERLPSVRDFLVVPLREDEVRCRVARLANAGSREAVRADVTEALGLAQLIGDDPAFVKLKRQIQLAARCESTVLLTGETGTGKERCARALHYLSARADKPFIPVNCGAIPAELFENELFGHLKGAFTGAVATHRGLISEAEGGTLLLDEIETLTPASQVKLLRFLQDHSYYAVGSARPRQANVWIVASTNAELMSKVKEGTFREDLYYRLAVINLFVPPLRDRKGDIPTLASYFWSVYAPRAGRSERNLSAQVMNALLRHSWPGNVRELENAVQQIAVLTELDTVRPEDVPVARPHAGARRVRDSFAREKAAAIEAFEKTYVTELLREHRGNVTHAARQARTDRRAFGRLVKKYGIAKP